MGTVNGTVEDALCQRIWDIFLLYAERGNTYVR